MFKNTLVLLAIVGFSAAGKLPESWKTCKTDPEMNTCLESAIAEAIESMKNGMPSLGATPLEPLHFDRVVVDQSSGPVAAKFEFKNMDIKGLTSLKIKNVESDLMGGHLKFQMHFKIPVVMEADYTVKGRILILPIQGKGKSRLVFDRFHMNIDMNGKVIEKKNEKYFAVENLTTEILPEHMTIHFSNLFNGNKALGDSTNRFFNENWPQIMKELGPAISRGLSDGFKEISNRVFQRISLNQIVKK